MDRKTFMVGSVDANKRRVARVTRAVAGEDVSIAQRGIRPARGRTPWADASFGVDWRLLRDEGRR